MLSLGFFIFLCFSWFFFGWVALGERLRPLGIAGLFAGLAGVSIIMGSRLSGGVDIVGLSLCVGGVLAVTLLRFAWLHVH